MYYYRPGRGGVPGKVFVRFLRGLYVGERTLFLKTPHIGPGLFIRHGFATIAAAERIGANCWINQQVTIGHVGDRGAPTIGDDVIITAGAVGWRDPSLLATGALMGANATVVKDVPAGGVAHGPAARVVQPGSRPTPVMRMSVPVLDETHPTRSCGNHFKHHDPGRPSSSVDRGCTPLARPLRLQSDHKDSEGTTMPVVLHVGPLDPARGGIASVISALSQDPAWSSRGWIMSTQNTYARPVVWGTCMTLLRAIGMAARPLSVDVVHIHTSRGLSLVRKLAVAAAVRGRCPVVVQLHSSALLSLGLAHGWELQLWRRLVDRADFILCLTDEAAQRIAFELPLERRASVTSVRNPSTDSGMVARNPSSGVHPILFLGRLGVGKGVDTLITALSIMEHTSAHLQLAGDGETDVWMALTRRLGVTDRCEFLGWVDGPERLRLMSRACALALPSRAEALPMSVIEAMAAGLPVVSTPVGGIPSLLTHGESGLLVRPDDPKALADALDRLAGDEELAIRLSSVARAIYEKELTPSKVITQLILVYDLVTKRP